MLKIKHQRTADCVVAGFRWHKDGPGTLIGSLLLGLYDDAGKLNHVGITASFTMARRAELVAELAPLREHAMDGHPWAEWAEWAEAAGGLRPAGARRDEPLEPRHATCPGRRSGRSGSSRSPTTTSRATGSGTGRRSSAGARTSAPEDCRYDQLEETAAYELSAIFGTTGRS